MPWSFAYNTEKNQYWLTYHGQSISPHFPIQSFNKDEFINLFEDMRDAYKEVKPRKITTKYRRLRRIK